jgi:hypothetical protein
MLKRPISSARNAISSKAVIIVWSCAIFKLFLLLFIFRHADREVVLEHVKSHYREDGTPQQDGKVHHPQQPQMQAAELGPPPPIPIQMPFQIMSNLLNGHSAGTSNVNNRNLITLGGGGSSNQASNQNPSNTHQTLSFNSQNTLLTPASQATVDVNRNNNGMPETNSASNNSNNSLKGSFRCGHCGQISNWKHVIQVYTNRKTTKQINNLCLLAMQFSSLYIFFIFPFCVSPFHVSLLLASETILKKQNKQNKQSKEEEDEVEISITSLYYWLLH